MAYVAIVVGCVLFKSQPYRVVAYVAIVCWVRFFLLYLSSLRLFEYILWLIFRTSLSFCHAYFKNRFHPHSSTLFSALWMRSFSFFVRRFDCHLRYVHVTSVKIFSSSSKNFVLWEKRYEINFKSESGIFCKKSSLFNVYMNYYCTVMKYTIFSTVPDPLNQCLAFIYPSLIPLLFFAAFSRNSYDKSVVIT